MITTLITLIINIIIALSMSGFFTLLLVTPPPTYLNFKPFNCRNCISFWSTLIFGMLITNSIYIVLVASFFSFYLVELIKKTLR